MSEELFRKKSLEKIKSPENLDDYIRVSNPGVWLLLISICVLLAGACIWGIFGHVDSTASSLIHVENGSAVCYASEENLASVEPGMTVKFEDYEAVITEIGQKESRGYVCTLQPTQTVPDGFYKGEIVINRIRPLSFVLN